MYRRIGQEIVDDAKLLTDATGRGEMRRATRGDAHRDGGGPVRATDTAVLIGELTEY
jgi:hypothetical protein